MTFILTLLSLYYLRLNSFLFLLNYINIFNTFDLNLKMEAQQEEIQLFPITEELKQEFFNITCNEPSILAEEVDKISVKAGFRMSKQSGSSSYIYFACRLGGRTRQKPEDLKETDKKSFKLSKLFYIFLTLLDCPFKFSYIFDTADNIYKLSKKKVFGIIIMP